MELLSLSFLSTALQIQPHKILKKTEKFYLYKKPSAFNKTELESQTGEWVMK